MAKIINYVAAALSAAGLGTAFADITGIADVPDSTWAKGVYILAILGGLLWRALPDQDDTPGPDVLQGEPLDLWAWAKNIAKTLGFAAAVLILAAGALGCGATTTFGTRTCFPAWSDNCLVVAGEASRRNVDVEVIETPDTSVSTEAWVKGPGVSASGYVEADPAVPYVAAEGCVNVLLWERCADVGTSEAPE